MNRRTAGRVVFRIGFVVLLVDGAAAIWLGQVYGRVVLVGVGVALLLAAAGLVVAYRRWMEALDAVEEARRELKDEIGRLRDAAVAARTSRPRN
jgi:hypothetical protein